MAVLLENFLTASNDMEAEEVRAGPSPMNIRPSVRPSIHPSVNTARENFLAAPNDMQAAEMRAGAATSLTAVLCCVYAARVL